MRSLLLRFGGRRLCPMEENAEAQELRREAPVGAEGHS
jgi:hypothetical protein